MLGRMLIIVLLAEAWMVQHLHASVAKGLPDSDCAADSHSQARILGRLRYCMYKGPNPRLTARMTRIWDSLGR
ncbi:hypothetical protein J3F83DRAFT_738155 [Trichoderma novae-zelandiae]